MATLKVPLVARSSQPQRFPALIALSTSAVTVTVLAPVVEAEKLPVAVVPIARPLTPFQVKVDELQLEVTGKSETVSAPAVLTFTVSTALSAPPVVGMLQPLRLKRMKAYF
jgi:hypothetical protein